MKSKKKQVQTIRLDTTKYNKVLIDHINRVRLITSMFTPKIYIALILFESFFRMSAETQLEYHGYSFSPTTLENIQLGVMSNIFDKLGYNLGTILLEFVMIDEKSLVPKFRDEGITGSTSEEAYELLKICIRPILRLIPSLAVWMNETKIDDNTVQYACGFAEVLDALNCLNTHERVIDSKHRSKEEKYAITDLTGALMTRIISLYNRHRVVSKTKHALFAWFKWFTLKYQELDLVDPLIMDKDKVIELYNSVGFKFKPSMQISFNYQHNRDLQKVPYKTITFIDSGFKTLSLTNSSGFDCFLDKSFKVY